MSEPTADLLFQYLFDILYTPNHQPLDLNALPPEFKKFGQGMQLLDEMVAEQRTFGLALAKGDLSVEPPSADNILAAPIKDLQASLRHLAWQTQQVAKGDYSQRVDFMGEFSESFNTMTRQLEERYTSLVAEKQKVEQKNAELNRSLELVSALTNYTHNMTFVFDTATGETLFTNDPAKWLAQVEPDHVRRLCALLTAHTAAPGSDAMWDLAVPAADEDGAAAGEGDGPTYYGVESFTINWAGADAVVHILIDQTERRRKENLMYRLSYTDPLTGLNNRRYAMGLMEQWQAESQPFLLSFIDLDYLKYCNDTFGHACGDRYLNTVAAALRTLGGELCRVGGDEFFLLRPGSDAAAQDARLNSLRHSIAAHSDAPYPVSFSYATIAVPAGTAVPLEEYIKRADAKMYEYKRQYKRDLPHYKDERLK